jgi:hypothetical protein
MRVKLSSLTVMLLFYLVPNFPLVAIQGSLSPRKPWHLMDILVFSEPWFLELLPLVLVVVAEES